jgi:hypothetical protein
MVVNALIYIESDFASAVETAAQYRSRTAAPRSGRRLRRAYRRVVRAS